MAVDLIRYDILAQAALRGVVRKVLADAAKKGLPGEHHFKITFSTVEPGVRLSDRMRAQYPEEMTIVLQHQFWDLTVTEQNFEVGLSFGGIPERIAVPFASVTAFYDPAVHFGFQFEIVDAGTADAGAAPPQSQKPMGAPGRAGLEEAKQPSLPASAPNAAPPPVSRTPDPHTGEPDTDGSGGEVVRLDRFRKK